MKNLLRMSLLGLTLLAGAGARAWDYKPGDLLLVVRKPAADDVLFNLGPVDRFLNRVSGESLTITNLDSGVLKSRIGVPLGADVRYTLVAATGLGDADPRVWTGNAESGTARDRTPSQWQLLWSKVDAIGTTPTTLGGTNGSATFVLSPKAVGSYDYIVSNGGGQQGLIPTLGGASAFAVEQAPGIPVALSAIRPSAANPKGEAVVVGGFVLTSGGQLLFSAGGARVGFSPLSKVVAGDVLSGSLLGLSANVPGTLVTVPPLGTVLTNGDYSVQAVFSPESPALSPVTRTVTFKVLTAAAAVSAGRDFNADGKADLLFQDASGYLAAWFLDGGVLKQATFLDPVGTGNPDWVLVGSADLNKDGSPDVIFQHKPTGRIAAWLLAGTKLLQVVTINPLPAVVGPVTDWNLLAGRGLASGTDPRWSVVATGDFDGDGDSDLLFQHADGTLGVWFLKGAVLRSVSLLEPSHPESGWRVVGVGDLNQDGHPDLVLQQEAGSALAVWYLSGTHLVSGEYLQPAIPSDSRWRAIGVTDVDNDGHPDVVLRLQAHGEAQVGEDLLGVWFLNGSALQRASLLSPGIPGGSWRVVTP